MNENSDIHSNLETEGYDKVDPEEIIRKLRDMINYLEKRRLEKKLHNEKECTNTTPY